MKNSRFLFYFIFTLACLLLQIASGYADGSKDLYPAGIKGGRGKLLCSTDPDHFQYATLGTHYIFAQEGETIALASSAMGTGCAEIRLTDPSGIMASYSGFYSGYIPDRKSELAGPNLPEHDISDNQYRPIYYIVPTNGAGIYRVDFISTGGENDLSADTVATNANDNWTQGAHTAYISAWDISVSDRNNAMWLPGRVYSKVLNLNIGAGHNVQSMQNQMYTLTNDGYLYKIRNKTDALTLFANNKGFIGAGENPLYRSLSGASSSFLKGKIHDARMPDTESDITYKMFYTLPDRDIPSSAISAGGETWLVASRLDPTITKVNLVGVEGTSGQLSRKGAYIGFDASISGKYYCTISSQNKEGDILYFPTRYITGFAKTGPNRILWDGKDGKGNFVPNGDLQIMQTLQLKSGEIHLPMINRKINPEGIQVELLKADFTTVESDNVYWDDSDISTSLDGPPKPAAATQDIFTSGISSNKNGHRWGVISDVISSTFGQGNSLDTWTFFSVREVLTSSLHVRHANLEIADISVSPKPAQLGEVLTYIVVTKNLGPTEANGSSFTFNVPPGIEIDSIYMTTACGIERKGAVSADRLHYRSILDLPNDCPIIYHVKVRVVTSSPDKIKVKASILRPNDVTDPDATNMDINTVPIDPNDECVVNVDGILCNNLRSDSSVFINVRKSAALDPIADQTICYTQVKQMVALTGISKEKGNGSSTAIRIDNSNTDLIEKIKVASSDTISYLNYQIKEGASGTALLTVFIKDIGGMENGRSDTCSRSFKVTVNPIPVIAVTSNKGSTVNKGELVTLDASGGTSYTYAWKDQSSIVNERNRSTLIVRPMETTTYSVLAVNADGCISTGSFRINVTTDKTTAVKANNILTPNHDGYNDRWVIADIDQYPGNEVLVFDRRERIVYRKKNYDNSWDGTFNGTPLPEGTYYYIINIGEAEEKFKGYITIVREQ